MLSNRTNRNPRTLAPAILLALAACGTDFAVRGGADGDEQPDAVEEPSAIVGADERPAIVFLGNSITAGLGVASDEAYPALVRERIDAADLSYRVVSAGVSGETTSGGLARIDLVLEQSPSILVVALGANDALRGVPAETVEANLQGIIDRARSHDPPVRVVLAGMLAPPNLGQTYAGAFRRVFERVADANELAFIPFLLEGVAADPALNQPDGIHPNPEGHRVIARTIWERLAPLLLPGEGA